MDDLISRQAAIDAFDDNIVVTGRENANEVRSYIKETMDKIKALPSADAVEVVRCKDCEHYIVGVCRCGSLPYSNFSDLANVWLTPRPEDYCSYGERKEP